MTKTQPDDRPQRSRILNPYGLGIRALVLYHVLILCLAILTFDRIAAYQFQPSHESREVVLVGSTTCPHSRAVRERLVAAEVPFRNIDTRENPISRALAVWTFQSFRVPIVVVGNDVIYGDRRDRIAASLAELGYPL